MSLAPIQYYNGIYLKRNDLCEYEGCYGGKAECIHKFITQAKTKVFVTCGSRDSLQCDIVSQMCDSLGYECHVFMPAGKSTPTIENIVKRKTELHRIENGYMVVVKNRAEAFAKTHNMTYIPFGMEHISAIETIAKQVENIPQAVKRIVVPIGGGVTLCGILKGLHDFKKRIEVLGIQTGKKPSDKLLNTFTYNNSYRILPYRENITPTAMYNLRTNHSIGGVNLDPIYEGKCYSFLEDDDLLWIVGYHEVN